MNQSAEFARLLERADKRGAFGEPSRPRCLRRPRFLPAKATPQAPPMCSCSDRWRCWDVFGLRSDKFADGLRSGTSCDAGCSDPSRQSPPPQFLRREAGESEILSAAESFRMNCRAEASRQPESSPSTGDGIITPNGPSLCNRVVSSGCLLYHPCFEG